MYRTLFAFALLLAACDQPRSSTVEPSSFSRINAGINNNYQVSRPCTLRPVAGAKVAAPGVIDGGWTANNALAWFDSSSGTMTVDGWLGRLQLWGPVTPSNDQILTNGQGTVFPYNGDHVDAFDGAEDTIPFTKPQSPLCSSLSGVLDQPDAGAMTAGFNVAIYDGRAVTPQFAFFLYEETWPDGTVVQQRLRATGRQSDGFVAEDIMLYKKD